MKKDKIESMKIFREPKGSPDITCYVRGVGINEKMRPGIVDRPTGTGDWLLMYFHDQVFIRSAKGIEEHPVGSWIIWAEKDWQYYGRTDKEWVHSWIHFKGKSVRPMITDCGFKSNNIFHLDSSEVLTESLSDIYRELVEHAVPDEIILQNLFENMLRKLARQTGYVETGYMPERILKIKNLLEANPVKTFQIPFLAKEASMSIPHFCAEFKKHVGTSPIEYLIRMRLQQARHLLYDRNLSISDIADRVGYHDIFHFSKQFKKHFGMSPRAMRVKKD